MKIDLEKFKACALRPTEDWFKDDFVKNGKFVVGGPKDNPYLYANYGRKILAVAHLDVVPNLKPVFEVAPMKGKEKEKDYIWTPYGDDRAGAYAILYHLQELGMRYDILLTTGEESGKSSAKLFHTDKKYNWMFSFDRHGDDVVMYSYEGSKLGENGFFDKLLALFDMKIGIGSYSDIEALQGLKCIGFNVGTGYHQEHSQNSYVDIEMFEAQASKFYKFYLAFKDIHMHYESKVKVYKAWTSSKPAWSRYDAYEGADDYYDESDSVIITPKADKGATGAAYPPVNDRIRWDEWRSRPWSCDCPSNEVHAPNVQKCAICGLSKAEYIRNFEGRIDNPPKGIASDKINWALIMDKPYVEFRKTVMTTVTNDTYVKTVVPFLDKFHSVTDPAQLAYRLKNKHAAIGRYLTFPEIVGILQEGGKHREFINGKLEDNAVSILNDVFPLLVNYTKNLQDQYKLARWILAHHEEKDIYVIDDYLEFHTRPEEGLKLGLFKSMERGKILWDALQNEPDINELWISPRPKSGSTQASSNSDAPTAPLSAIA